MIFLLITACLTLHPRLDLTPRRKVDVFLAMRSQLAYWLKKAQTAINEDWERCDEGTGRECPSQKCPIGAHRAMTYLERAAAQENQAEALKVALLAAIKIGLQKHEPYPGYKTTMLRQAIKKATGRKTG